MNDPDRTQPHPGASQPPAGEQPPPGSPYGPPPGSPYGPPPGSPYGPPPHGGQQPPYGAPPAGPPWGPAAGTTDERTWAMLAHLSSFAGLVVPLGNILGPLVVWLIKRDVYPLVADQGRESLNFQISLTIYMVVAGILMFLVVGLLLLPVVAIFGIVVTIMGAVAANRGERYRYPLCIRFITD